MKQAECERQKEHGKKESRALRALQGEEWPREKKGRGWGAAGMWTDGGARESEAMHHSHSSKDIILFLLVYLYY